jgi:hypothetical protein
MRWLCTTSGIKVEFAVEARVFSLCLAKDAQRDHSVIKQAGNPENN